MHCHPSSPATGWLRWEFVCTVWCVHRHRTSCFKSHPSKHWITSSTRYLLAWSVCNWNFLNTNYYRRTFGGLPGSFDPVSDWIGLHVWPDWIVVGLSSQSGRLWLLSTLSVCLSVRVCLSRFYGLYLSYYGLDFDQTWWEYWNLGPIDCVEIWAFCGKGKNHT